MFPAAAGPVLKSGVVTRSFTVCPDGKHCLEEVLGSSLYRGSYLLLPWPMITDQAVEGIHYWLFLEFFFFFFFNTVCMDVHKQVLSELLK